MRLVQLIHEGARRVAVPSDDGGALRLLRGVERVRDLVLEAARDGQPLAALATAYLSEEALDYDRVLAEGQLLAPLDHTDPAHLFVTGTGLTHLGSAQSRDAMHTKLALEEAQLTDSMKMFRLGLEGGRPAAGAVGVAPEWFYKGDGQCVVAPGQPLELPSFAEDGGEEAELVGLYVISETGEPLRVGFAVGNEFSDHALEAQNYLYLAHSKLRDCSFGPELRLGALPEHIEGRASISRGGREVWSGGLLTGEANMSHAIANLEHHHFKYDIFRRPGDVHIHFFGASVLSSSSAFEARDGDVFEMALTGFGRPLRNPLRASQGRDALVKVKVL